MSTILNEIARAKNLSGAKESSFKGVTPRSTERNTLRSGDIFTVPADYVCLEQEIRNGQSRRDPATGRMVKPTAKYLFVEVEREGKTIPVAFYPSAYWKRRRVAVLVPDEEDSSKNVWINSDEYVSASGDAAEFVQGFADLDDALKAIAGKKQRVTRKEVNTLPYGVDSLPEEDARVRDSVLTFTFVTE